MGLGRALTLAALAALVFATVSGAGNIDYISSRSAHYIKNFSRNAATDAVDIISYNPAGLTLLPDGFHLQANNQFLLVHYGIESRVPGSTEPESFDSDKPVPFLPSFYAAWVSGDLAVYGAFTVPGGGGSLDYEDGISAMPLIETAVQQGISGNPYYFALMDEGGVEASSMYLGGTLGLAYSMTDWLSASAHMRYISAKRTYDITGEFNIIDGSTMTPVGTSSRALDSEKTASGIGGVFGLCVSSPSGFRAALRYEMEVPLEFETSTTVNDWSPFGIPELASFEDGYTQNRNLPAVLGVGVSYPFSPCFEASLSGNYYFLGSADEGEDDAIDDDYDDGWEIAVGADYKASPVLSLGAGYQFTDVGGNSDTYNDFEFNLDAHFVGAGATYSFSDAVRGTLAIGRLMFVEGSTDPAQPDWEDPVYDKGNWYFGAGIDASLL